MELIASIVMGLLLLLVALLALVLLALVVDFLGVVFFGKEKWMPFPIIARLHKNIEDYN